MAEREDAARLLAELQDAVRDRDAALAAVRERETELRLALHAGRMGTWNWSPRSGALRWAVELETIHGLPLGSFPGTFDAFIALIHPRDRDRVVDEIQSITAKGEQFSTEYRVVWPDGSLHWIAGDGQVFRDPSGQPLQMLGIGYEITARRRSEERQRLRAEASRALDLAGLDEGRILAAIGAVLQEILGAEITIQLLDEKGEIFRPAVVLDRDTELGKRRDAMLRDAPLRVGEGISGMVVATGVPLLLEDTGAGTLAALTRPEHRSYAEEVAGGSLIAVPMRAHGRAIGSLLVVGRAGDVRYTHDDVRLVQEIADHAALAVMNVRLYEAERRAHAQADAALQLRDEFLAI
ncbi:MAG TPA: PAS domain-containing protein, partial [Chloroflexota bacterium]|nr:PAS domain-containing protein [Chloroflexota bacterium]